MIIVKLIINSGLKKVINKDFIEVSLNDNSNFTDLIEEIINVYGEELQRLLFSEKYGFNWFCIKNKKKVLITERLEKGDEVTFYPPLAGG